jgi:hypothetical protein
VEGGEGPRSCGPRRARECQPRRPPQGPQRRRRRPGSRTSRTARRAAPAGCRPAAPCRAAGSSRPRRLGWGAARPLRPGCWALRRMGREGHHVRRLRVPAGTRGAERRRAPRPAALGPAVRGVLGSPGGSKKRNVAKCGGDNRRSGGTAQRSLRPWVPQPGGFEAEANSSRRHVRRAGHGPTDRLRTCFVSGAFLAN